MNHLVLTAIPARQMAPGCDARFIHAERFTLSYWDLAEGSVVPEHGHPHEQAVNVLEGRFQLTVEGQARVLGPGEVVVIAPDQKHSGLAITRCRLLDVFCPVREDYR